MNLPSKGEKWSDIRSLGSVNPSRAGLRSDIFLSRPTLTLILPDSVSEQVRPVNPSNSALS